MASIPDPHPDSLPPEPAGSPEQVDLPAEPGREDVETPMESHGSSGGTAGTGGDDTDGENTDGDDTGWRQQGVGRSRSMSAA